MESAMVKPYLPWNSMDTEGRIKSICRKLHGLVQEVSSPKTRVHVCPTLRYSWCHWGCGPNRNRMTPLLDLFASVLFLVQWPKCSLGPISRFGRRKVHDSYRYYVGAQAYLYKI